MDEKIELIKIGAQKVIGMPGYDHGNREIVESDNGTCDKIDQKRILDIICVTKTKTLKEE